MHASQYIFSVAEIISVRIGVGNTTASTPAATAALPAHAHGREENKEMAVKMSGLRTLLLELECILERKWM